MTMKIRLADAQSTSEEIDTSTLTEEELARLKEEDPFMYHSVRSTKRRSSCCDFDDDLDMIKESGTSFNSIATSTSCRTSSGNNTMQVPTRVPTSPSSRRTSMPCGMLANADIARSQLVPTSPISSPVRSTATTSTNVVRRRRFSTEAHPNLVFQTMLSELHEVNGDEEDDMMEEGSNLGNGEDEEDLFAFMEDF